MELYRLETAFKLLLGDMQLTPAQQEELYTSFDLLKLLQGKAVGRGGAGRGGVGWGGVGRGGVGRGGAGWRCGWWWVASRS